MTAITCKSDQNRKKIIKAVMISTQVSTDLSLKANIHVFKLHGKGFYLSTLYLSVLITMKKMIDRWQMNHWNKTIIPVVITLITIQFGLPDLKFPDGQ